MAAAAGGRAVASAEAMVETVTAVAVWVAAVASAEAMVGTGVMEVLEVTEVPVAKGMEVELADCRCQRRGTHGPGRNCHPPETRCGW